jgi:hypothetical protein
MIDFCKRKSVCWIKAFFILEFLIIPPIMLMLMK